MAELEWCKLYARLRHDDRVQDLSDKGFRLFIESMCYAAESESDGFIPDTQLARFGIRKASLYASELVAVELWTVVPRGWQISSWQKLQPGSEKVRAKRDADRKRIAASRASSALLVGDVANESHACSAVEESRGEENLSPNPTQSVGNSCAKHPDKPGASCKGCGTNPRAVRAEAAKRGTWCGACDEETRMFYDDEDRPSRCSCATPMSLRVVS